MKPFVLVALRGAAIAIAIAAVFDPALARERRVPTEVAFVSGALSGGDSASRRLGEQVRGMLARQFTVVDAPFAGASATVLIGQRLPMADDAHATETEMLAQPVFSVIPTPLAPIVRVAAVRNPDAVSLEESARLDIDIEARGARGDSIVVLLHRGTLLVDRVARSMASETSVRATMSLTFIPTDTTLTALRARAVIVRGAREVASSPTATVAIAVRTTRRAALFYDPRPSWMSTFVRRAVEGDARISVASRIATARGISTDAGRPPLSLADLRAVSEFDVVIVGAPDALTSRDVAGLETYLRRRGGSVVLLIDNGAASASLPYQRLTQASGWSAHVERAVASLTTSSRAASQFGVPRRDGDSVSSDAALRISEWMAPQTLPVGALSVLELAGANDRRSAVVWQTSVGAGMLLVSGALDSWRYRDSSQSAFVPFWRNTISSLASMAVPRVTVRAHPAVALPGEPVALDVSVRDRWDPRVDASPVQLSAHVVDSTLRDVGPAIAFAPGVSPGTVAGRFSAPTTPGHYRVLIDVGLGSSASGLDSARANAEFVVSAASDERGEAPDGGADRDALFASWIAAHGGHIVLESSVSSLVQQIDDVLEARGRPTRRVVTWHPMRSAWWMIPFAALLAAEWYFRRRRGLV